MSPQQAESNDRDVTIPLRRFPTALGVLYCATDLLSTLAGEAQAGYAAKPWGGVERGGVLLGTRAGGPATILERVEAECEHEYGPAFELTEADKGQFADLLERLSQGDREIVGWFRTTSKDLAMTAADAELADAFFGQPGQLTLVIKRGKEQEPVFGWWQRTQQGEWQFALECSASKASAKPVPVVEPAPVVEPVSVEEGGEIFVGQTPSSAPDPLVGLSGDDTSAREADQGVGCRPGGLPHSEEAFTSTPDPRFWIPTRTHQDAFDKLSQGIQMRKGCLILTGAAGTGKTFVLEHLAESMKDAGVEFAFVANSRLNAEQFFELLGIDLDLACRSYGKVPVLMALQERVLEAAGRGSTVTIVVDNAHRLASEVLEEIDLLGNFESRRGKLLQIVLAGDLELEEKIRALSSLRQRIGVRVKVAPLDELTTAAYIRGRIEKAGGKTDELFGERALHEIWARTGGVPRLINMLASALVERVGDGERKPATAENVEEAAHEMELDRRVTT